MLARDGSSVIVRPRVFVRGEEQRGTLLLEDVVRRWLDEDRRGVAYLCGPPGSGKTTALESLREVFATDARLVLRDEDRSGPRIAPGSAVLVLEATARSATEVVGSAATLTGWQLDDCIEYALGAHHERSKSILRRWNDAHLDFDGDPELCRVALDRLASDELLPDARMAAVRHIDELLCDGDVRDAAIELCVRIALSDAPATRRTLQEQIERRLGRSARGLRRGPFVDALAAERLARHIEAGSVDPHELLRMNQRFQDRLVAELADKPRAWVRLWRWTQRFELRDRARFAGMCHELAPRAFGRRLAREAARARPVSFVAAHFSRAPWAGTTFARLELPDCDLRHADLSRSRCERLLADRACLRNAKLSEATFDSLALAAADLRDADLSHVRAREADFRKARLGRARFDHATLQGADFTETNLTEASFRHADLTSACFVGAELSGVNFGGATLVGAALPRLDLRTCCFDGVRATRVDVAGARLESVVLADVDFELAWLVEARLTGARLVRANFSRASLTKALLANLQAPGVDLRGADLSAAVFHLGSTRSGLVFGAPMEGSRTGFYDRDTLELAYKRPEEVRVANLVGADLRGVRFELTDFYLVDLRGARLDPALYQHAKRCGAILDPA